MKKVLIIAEAGVNHNGDMTVAKALIEVAALAGVDFVKFQTFKATKVASPEAGKAAYQVQNTKEGKDQLQMLKALELSEKDHYELIRHSQLHGVSFLSTGFDIESLEFLNSLGLDRFKVPSGELTNYPYLRKVASFGKPVILSTGIAEMSEIREALEVLNSNGVRQEDITVLHCNTEYPTPMEDVNLTAMLTIGREFECKFGYSDHTLGIEVPIAAVALGATVIEKHFTLSRSLPGPDHIASLEPKELNAMVLAIRNVEKALEGNGEKVPSKSESKNKSLVRKSVFIAKYIDRDEIIDEDHLITLRPGDGISPMKWEQIIGKRALKKMDSGHKLTWEDLS